MDATGSGGAVAISDSALARCIVNTRKGTFNEIRLFGKERKKKKKERKKQLT